MTDSLRSRTYAMVKEGMATGGFPAESGASQIPEVIMAQSEGRLNAEDAHRVSTMRAMGKANNLFRNGNNAEERKTVIEILSKMVKREKGRAGGFRWRFAMTTCECVAVVAVDETWRDMCPTCMGAGVVPLDFANAPVGGRQPMSVCGTCSGSRKRKYGTDERIAALAAAWMHKLGVEGESALTETMREIRGNKQLQATVEAIDWAKGKLLEAERMAVEGAAEMMEKW